jgi:hypothetical protein
MLCLLKLIFGVLLGSFRARRDLLLENLALRQQLCAMARRRPLGYAAPPMVRMANGTDPGPTGDRCALASSRVQAVLEMDFAVQSSRRQKVDEQGSP